MFKPTFRINHIDKNILKKEDIYTYYLRLSNVELLKIIQEKEKYRPDAIDAATEILSTRTYTNDEHAVAAAELNVVLKKKTVQKEKVFRIKTQINDFIDTHFGIKKRSPQKKLNLFCAAIFIYTLINAIVNFEDRAIIFYYNDPKGYVVAALIYALEFIFIYLLYKRTNWGWVIFVFFSSLTIIMNLKNLLSSFNQSDDLFFIPASPATDLFSILVNTAILIFLNSKEILNQFTITRDGRQTTFMVVVVAACLILFITYFL